MARLDFCELAPATGKSSDLDQFEKFAKIFFERVVGAKVTKGPSRGADGGIDLRVEFHESGVTVAKLVSCKHYAHSKESVGNGAEVDIQDRLTAFACTEFIGFYSTIASTALEQKLERLRANAGIAFQFYNSEDIETSLLESHAGFLVAKRFFPNSVRNMWPQVISLLATYTEEDATEIEGRWSVPAAFEEGEILAWANRCEDAVRYANEKAMTDIHRPMFLSAWKDAVRMYPDYFEVSAKDIETAQSISQLQPNWAAVDKLSLLRPSPRWSLLAIWSLVDAKRVRSILRSLHHDASQQETDLMAFSWLAMSTQTERRDILTRLFAYCAF